MNVVANSNYKTVQRSKYQESKLRRQRQVQRQKNMLYAIAVVVILLLILTVSVLLFNTPNKAEASISGHYEYECITVNSGDSLWSIAQNNRNSYPGSLEQFIDEVVSINQLNTYEIKAGESIIIPTYCNELP